MTTNEKLSADVVIIRLMFTFSLTQSDHIKRLLLYLPNLCLAWSEFSDINSVSRCQFHQHYMPAFFKRKSFWQLFSIYMYIVKAAKTTFVQKIGAYNVDEMDGRQYFRHVLKTFIQYRFTFESKLALVNVKIIMQFRYCNKTLTY